VVVVEGGTKKAGLIVDSFLGQQDVVIKPLTGLLKEIKGASGATILGTGKPSLIMDVGSLLQKEMTL
jgi:two-component system chemotaxis sensor kinase CheA